MSRERSDSWRTPPIFRTPGLQISTAAAGTIYGALINPRELSDRIVELLSCLVWFRPESPGANGGAVALWTCREAPGTTSRVNLVPAAPMGPRISINEWEEGGNAVALVANCNVGDGGAVTSIPIGTSTALVATTALGRRAASAEGARLVARIGGSYGTNGTAGTFGAGDARIDEMLQPAPRVDQLAGLFLGPGEMAVVQALNNTADDENFVAWAWREWTPGALDQLHSRRRAQP